jgi:histidinol-phosphatase
MPDESLEALLQTAVDAALQAGRVTLRHFRTGLVPDRKADGTPVTMADREGERMLRRIIGRRYPRHGILGEEEGETRSGAPFRWILDPLDGTRAFVHGSPIYGVMIGLEREGETVLGVVHMPVLDETVAAGKGLGCTWNGRPCRVSGVARLREGLLLTTDMKIPGSRGAAIARAVRASAMARTWGDCYGYVMVATGRAEAMIDPVMKVWDCAALLPILEEAGGTFTDWKGRPTIHGGDAVATNGRVQDELMRLLVGVPRGPRAAGAQASRPGKRRTKRHG